jgi:hypothetical protein
LLRKEAIMAKACKCDKCGKYFDSNATWEAYKEKQNGRKDLKFHLRYWDDEEVSWTDFDLCPNCYKALYKFLTGEYPKQKKENADE